MSNYLAFALFALLLAVVPGPDTMLTLRATVVGGRARGLWTLGGITLAGTIQGCLAALGLGAIIIAAEPVFFAIRWAGVAYLAYLGAMALRAAFRRHNEAWASSNLGTWTPRAAFVQGFLCNITNPKVLMFNVAVLPQFTGDSANIPTLLLFGMTLNLIGIVYLGVIIQAAAKAMTLITKEIVRRWIDGVTGVVFLGFAGALAADG